MLLPFARIAVALAIAPLAVIALGFALALEATGASRPRDTESVSTRRKNYFGTRQARRVGSVA